MLMIDQFLALILRSESGLGTPLVLPDSTRKAICYANVGNRVIPVRDNADPEVVISWQRSGSIRHVSTSLDMTIVVLERLATQLWPACLAGKGERFSYGGFAGFANRTFAARDGRVCGL
jgi:hypothetical protein